MVASDNLQPKQFGGDANFHQHDSLEDDPAYWTGQRFDRAGSLSPDAELHTTQEWHDPEQVEHLTGLARQGTQWRGRPLVAEISGKTWVAGGHHRLLADRRAGRSTPVLYGE
jgi:hypothetical protein